MGLRHQPPRHSIGRNFRSAPSDHTCNSRSLDHPHAPAFRLNALVLAGTCVLTGLGGTLALAPQAVQAAEPAAAAAQDYAIPAGRLSDALAQFAAASGVALSFDPQALQGQQSTGLQGSYTVQQGFARLLDGTGWWVQPQQGNTYTLQNTPASSTRGTSEPGTLPEVVVMADATQPGYPAEAYVGGQVARGSRVGLLGNKDMLDTPFNVTSYTSELIHNQQAYSLADVMENNPAVQVVNGAARNTETFVMRGFPTGMNNVALNGVYGLVPVYRILPDYIDRVEVLNGPNALLGGMTKGGQVGGTINLMPKRAEDEPLVRLTLGVSADSQWRTHADVGHRFGKKGEWGIRVNGSYQYGDTPMNNQSKTSHVGALALDYRGERLRASVDLVDQEEQMDDGMQVAFGMASTVLKPPSNNSISVPGADYMGRDKTAMVRAEYDITPETMIYGAWGKRTDDHLATLGYPTVQPNGDFTLRATTARYAYDTQAGHAGLNTRLKTGTVGHQLAFSVNYFDEDYASAGAVGAPGTSNMYQPVPLPMPVAPGAAQKSTDTRLTSFALADTISFYDDRLQLTLGLRKQQVKTFNVASNTLYNKSAVTPMAGLVFKLRGNVSIYGNYIEGLTQGPTAPENTGLDNAGEVFAPYKTKQQEVGVKVDWGNLTTTLSAYQIARPNPITENNIYSLDGEQRNRGIELNVFGELNRSLRLLAGATIIDTQVTKAVGDTLGKKPSGVPATQLKFGTEWDTPFVPGLTLTARASYSSSQYLDGTNTKKVPNWNRLDLGARYATQIAGKDVVFRANVNNALDKDYWAAVNSGYLVLGAPRTWTLSATVDF